MDSFEKLNQEICTPFSPENLKQVLERIQAWKECTSCQGWGTLDNGKRCKQCSEVVSE